MRAEDEVVLLRDALRPVMGHDMSQYGAMRCKPDIVRAVRETRYKVEEIDAKKLTDQVSEDPRVRKSGFFLSEEALVRRVRRAPREAPHGAVPHVGSRREEDAHRDDPQDRVVREVLRGRAEPDGRGGGDCP